MHLVLFGMKNTTLRPYLAAMHGIFISEMRHLPRSLPTVQTEMDVLQQRDLDLSIRLSEHGAAGTVLWLSRDGEHCPCHG
jgi:hypothetical protein